VKGEFDIWENPVLLTVLTAYRHVGASNWREWLSVSGEEA